MAGTRHYPVTRPPGKGRDPCICRALTASKADAQLSVEPGQIVEIESPPARESPQIASSKVATLINGWHFPPIQQPDALARRKAEAFALQLPFHIPCYESYLSVHA